MNENIPNYTVMGAIGIFLDFYYSCIVKTPIGLLKFYKRDIIK